MAECICGKKFQDDPASVIEINQEAKVPFIYKIEVPAESGDDTVNPPMVGAHRNTIVEYLANGHIYIYTSDGAYTLLATSHIDEYTISVNGKSGAVTLTAKDVGALPDTTVIPTKNSQLENDSRFVDFTALNDGINALRVESDRKYIGTDELNEKFQTVPTKTSQLQNDSGFVGEASINAETNAREQADTAIRNDMVKIKMSKVDPGEGSPLEPNTILGIYR